MQVCELRLFCVVFVQMLKEAIQQVTDMNPDMSVQKIEIHTNTETWAAHLYTAHLYAVQVLRTCTAHLYSVYLYCLRGRLVTWLHCYVFE